MIYRFLWLTMFTASVAIPINGCGRVACCVSLAMNGKEQSVHYLVIGIGLISIPKPGNTTGILAAKTQTLGMSLSDQPTLKAALGYASSSVVAIPQGAEDVRVEMSQKPFGPLTIDTQAAKFGFSAGK